MANPKTYTTSAELQGNTLQYDDHVIFSHGEFHVEYEVHSVSLHEINENYSIENDIFELLNLDPFEFCEQRYSMLPNEWEECKEYSRNIWPPYCDEDYESITKVVLGLFRLIEERKNKQQQVLQPTNSNSTKPTNGNNTPAQTRKNI